MVDEEKKLCSEETIETKGLKLVSQLVMKGMFKISPFLDRTGIHYPEIEKVCTETDPAQTRAILEKLALKGDLKTGFTEQVLTCPHCCSPEVYSKYACPKCTSFYVSFVELIEHIGCGFIDSKEKFVRENALVCPECKKMLGNKEFKTIGSCYQCGECGERFEKPDITHICQQCKKSFNYREASYVKVSAYEIPEETIKKFAKEVPLSEVLTEVLREKGLEVQLNATVTGQSGLKHTFSITARKGDFLLVVENVLSGERQELMDALAKKTDVNPTLMVLIDFSNRNEASFDKVSGLVLVKTSDKRTLRENLQGILDKLFVQCPKCGASGVVLKQWICKPKVRVGPSLKITLCQCSSGHKWRDTQKIRL